MSVGVFTDKGHPPTLEEIMAAIGSKQPAWEELTRYVLAP
jgi:hypothetical protein